MARREIEITLRPLPVEPISRAENVRLAIALALLAVGWIACIGFGVITLGWY